MGAHLSKTQENPKVSLSKQQTENLWNITPDAIAYLIFKYLSITELIGILDCDKWMYERIVNNIFIRASESPREFDNFVSYHLLHDTRKHHLPKIKFDYSFKQFLAHSDGLSIPLMLAAKHLMRQLEKIEHELDEVTTDEELNILLLFLANSKKNFITTFITIYYLMPPQQKTLLIDFVIEEIETCDINRISLMIILEPYLNCRHRSKLMEFFDKKFTKLLFGVESNFLFTLAQILYKKEYTDYDDNGKSTYYINEYKENIAPLILTSSAESYFDKLATKWSQVNALFLTSNEYIYLSPLFETILLFVSHIPRISDNLATKVYDFFMSERVMFRRRCSEFGFDFDHFILNANCSLVSRSSNVLLNFYTKAYEHFAKKPELLLRILPHIKDENLALLRILLIMKKTADTTDYLQTRINYDQFNTKNINGYLIKAIIHINKILNLSEYDGINLKEIFECLSFKIFNITVSNPSNILDYFKSIIIQRMPILDLFLYGMLPEFADALVSYHQQLHEPHAFGPMRKLYLLQTPFEPISLVINHLIHGSTSIIYKYDHPNFQALLPAMLLARNWLDEYFTLERNKEKINNFTLGLEELIRLILACEQPHQYVEIFKQELEKSLLTNKLITGYIMMQLAASLKIKLTEIDVKFFMVYMVILSYDHKNTLTKLVELFDVGQLTYLESLISSTQNFQSDALKAKLHMIVLEKLENMSKQKTPINVNMQKCSQIPEKLIFYNSQIRADIRRYVHSSQIVLQAPSRDHSSFFKNVRQACINHLEQAMPASAAINVAPEIESKDNTENQFQP